MNNKLIDKINKLLNMDKKGLSDTDIIEVIKIIVLVIVGYIIIKALLTLA